jgi:hypothetical protein
MKSITALGVLLILPFSLVAFLCFVGGNLVMPWFLLWLATAFVVAYFVSSIFHELAHFITFKCFGLSVVELSFGVFRVFFIEHRIESLFTPNKPFDVLCSCKGLRDISKWKRSICLLSGGLVNLIIAVILVIVLLFISSQQIRLLAGIQIAPCIINVLVNIVYPYSEDRKLLRELNQQDKNKTHRGNA